MTYVSKDVLTKSTVSIGIQVLNLRPANVVLADRRDSDWMWGQGNDASMVVPGRYIQQISPNLVSEQKGALPGTVAYGFQSEELCNLAAVMFHSLASKDVCGLVEMQPTENFPYKIEGVYLHG